MAKLPDLRVIIESSPKSGVWNMAVDETLLETAISQNVATLRWYEWSEPTISLGYFQKLSDVAKQPLYSRLPVVRRLSGGGAILHDDELTYSLTLPASQTLCSRPEELYEIVHHSISFGLNRLGFPVSFRGQSVKQVDEPLMCFFRQDARDLILNGKKVLGSAQRRRRGAIMEHGSLVRRASMMETQTPGLADLSDRFIPDNLAEILASHIAESVATTWIAGGLTEEEVEFARRLCERIS